ncbi:MAG: glycoside hydrolase family 99-like domain-containing protein [Oscillospiraceae bacterium]|nr:glycoside hydrolase family 99-like domain-containing protein [Oscillospiraceae bacterium]
MQILAINLPQFHSIPENDEWWGKGFTEWVNVKKAKPLYKGHVQPLVPYNNNYYDLSRADDMIAQANLAKEYGIGGFVYYHYWFNGKKLLEKPCELLLEHPEADIDFCFCWANEPWTRAWDGKNKQVIMPQTFGGREDWEAHLQYFLKFFSDDRYIKKNNKPMLFIYSPSRIPHFEDMMEYWNKRIKEYGFDGIYLVEYISTMNPDAFSKYSEAVMEFEPLFTCRFGISNIKKAKRLLCKKLKTLDVLDYDYIWKKVIERNRTYGGREIFSGALSGWDNTPRKGKAGMVIKNGSPEKFEKYLNQLVDTVRQDGSKDYMVINAWNEWGEGAILEPTKQDSYKYLEAIKRISERIR